jgi:hypothetical protein
MSAIRGRTRLGCYECPDFKFDPVARLIQFVLPAGKKCGPEVRRPATRIEGKQYKIALVLIFQLHQMSRSG